MTFTQHLSAPTGAVAIVLATLSPAVVSATELPTSSKGFAMVMEPSDDLDAYHAVDMICVGKSHNVYMAFSNTGPGKVSFVAPRYDGQLEEQAFVLGEAEGAAGSVRIPYHLAEEETLKGSFTFANPGALDDPDRIAMPTLSSVEIFDGKAPCVMGADIVYLGVADDRRLVITADETGALTLTEFDGETELRSLAGGRFATGKADEVVFLFTHGNDLTMIKAAPHNRQTYPAWTVSSPDERTYGNSPKAFFAADMMTLGAAEQSLPYGLAIHLERLDICRHLAGEVSGNAERDAQVAASWEKAGCDEAMEREADFLSDYADDKAISAILTSRKLYQ